MSSLYCGGSTKVEKAFGLKVMFEIQGMAKVSHILFCRE